MTTLQKPTTFTTQSPMHQPHHRHNSITTPHFNPQLHKKLVHDLPWIIHVMTAGGRAGEVTQRAENR